MITFLFTLFVVVVSLQCCNGNKERCYKVDSKNICYFQARGEKNKITWRGASEACRKNNSTLPVIKNERVQEILADHLNEQNSTLSEIWLAGREIRTNEWLWLNGKSMTNLTHVRSIGNRSYAVLTKERNFSSEVQNASHNYICKYRGKASCQFKEATIAFRRSCIVVFYEESLNFTKAREKCLDGGGDLATFEDDEDLTILQSHHMKLIFNSTYWIGLSRFLWIWNITEQNNGSNFVSICRYMRSGDDKWHQGPCNENRGSILCQTVTTDDSEMYFSIELLVAIIIGVAVGLVIIITVIFAFRKLCREEDTEGKDRLSDENQTDRDECKVTEEMTEMCGLYAEVTQQVRDIDHGKNANEPQTSIVYATLEFDNNKVAKEELTTSNPHKLDAASAPGKSVGKTGISQVHALDANIYSEII